MEKNRVNGSTSRLMQALEYSKLGWSVLPVHSVTKNSTCTCQKSGCGSVAKHPCTDHGSKDASRDPSLICQWWNRWPRANIGIATGSCSGVIVVDIDPRNGGDESWGNFVKHHDLPASLNALTSNEGRHIYYRCPAGLVPNKAGLLPGVDIRGEGGYVVAPPSVHASGHVYQWGSDLSNTDILPLPRALEDLILKAKRPTSNLCEFKMGSRNNTLTSIAGLLRRHGLEEEGIRQALLLLNQALCETPLEADEVRAIAKSILRYEYLVKNSAEEAWRQPLALPELKTLVPKLTEDYLPASVRPWILDIVDRMQIPTEFIASPVISSMSSVIGRQLGIFPKQEDDWLVVPNLWGAVIARPGYFKSPAIAEALKPLEWLVAKERAKFESAVIVAQIKEDIVKAKVEGIKEKVKKAVRKSHGDEIQGMQQELEGAFKELEKLKIYEKRYKTNDATVEKIGALLLENPQGLFLFRDELSGWLSSLQKSGREGDREFYLEAWNGYGSYTVDRIVRGTLHIPSLCLSVFGGIQPGKLDSYISHALHSSCGDDGLLQRFQILVYPETSKQWKNIDRKPNRKAYEDALQIFDRLANLTHCELGAKRNDSRSIQGIHFDYGAQEIFNEWRTKLEYRLRADETGSPAFESHLSKYRSMVPSLALIFHLGSDDFRNGAVGKDSIELAIKWAQLLEAHARKVYSSAIHSDLKAAHALAAKIKIGAVKDKDTVRSVYRRCWSNLENSQQVDKALSILEDLAWLRVDQVKVTYRTKDEIRLNPQLIF